MSQDDDDFKSGFGQDDEDEVFGEDGMLDIEDALLDDDGEILDEDDEEGFEDEFASDDVDAI